MRGRPAVIQRLTDLRLFEGPGVTSFIDSIAMSNLQALSVSAGRFDPLEWPGDAIQQFIKRSNCAITALELRRLVPPAGLTVETLLFIIPHLTKLVLSSFSDTQRLSLLSQHLLDGLARLEHGQCKLLPRLLELSLSYFPPSFLPAVVDMLDIRINGTSDGTSGKSGLRTV